MPEHSLVKNKGTFKINVPIITTENVANNFKGNLIYDDAKLLTILLTKECRVENNIRSYEETIDDTYQGWAEESIERFVNELLDQPLLEEYTLEQLKQKFRELEIHELNKYEIRTLSEKYDEIMNNIQEELKKRRNNYKLAGRLKFNPKRTLNASI